MEIVTSEIMQFIENHSQEMGVSKDALMHNAGLSIATFIKTRYMETRMGQNVVVLTGPGNNGGDGLVAAHHLHSWGFRTNIYLCMDRPIGDKKLSALKTEGTSIVNTSSDNDLQELRELLSPPCLVIDAVLGTGKTRPLDKRLVQIFSAVNQAKTKCAEIKIISIDLPSGLNPDDGSVESVCPKADVTLSLGHPKIGLFLFPGIDVAGYIEVIDIGLPSRSNQNIHLDLMENSWAKNTLPKRPLMSNKGTFGRAMIVAGSREYLGAAYLAAIAAYRSGAGLVTLAIPESLQHIVAAKAVEPTYLPLRESKPGILSEQAADQIIDRLSDYQYDSLLVGPGMGQTQGSTFVIEKLLYSKNLLLKTVVDADALNCLANSKTGNWWELFARTAIITPHHGEMARLAHSSTNQVLKTRIDLAINSAIKWNKVIVLKGPYTIIAFPSGHARLSPFANPGLATAGTGDVLAGSITGLLAQGLSLADSSSIAVYINGFAGERIKESMGDTGMIASDLLNVLPKSIHEIKNPY